METKDISTWGPIPGLILIHTHTVACFIHLVTLWPPIDVVNQVIVATLLGYARLARIPPPPPPPPGPDGGASERASKRVARPSAGEAAGGGHAEGHRDVPARGPVTKFIYIYICQSLYIYADIHIYIYIQYLHILYIILYVDIAYFYGHSGACSRGTVASKP